MQALDCTRQDGGCRPSGKHAVAVFALLALLMLHFWTVSSAAWLPALTRSFQAGQALFGPAAEVRHAGYLLPADRGESWTVEGQDRRRLGRLHSPARKRHDTRKPEPSL